MFKSKGLICSALLLTVMCEPGHYMKNKVCESCPNGEYQDEAGQFTCKTCPLKQITLEEGAVDEQECIGEAYMMPVSELLNTFYSYTCRPPDSMALGQYM